MCHRWMAPSERTKRAAESPQEARVSSSAEPFTERHYGRGVLRDHRVHADQPVDRSQANAANSRDDLLVLLRHGGRGRTAGSSGETAEARRASKTHHLIRGALQSRRQPRFTLRGSSFYGWHEATPANSPLPGLHFQRRSHYPITLSNSSAERDWDILLYLLSRMSPGGSPALMIKSSLPYSSFDSAITGRLAATSACRCERGGAQFQSQTCVSSLISSEQLIPFGQIP